MGQEDSQLLALVSQPIAHEIIRALADGEIDVTTLAERLELDGSAVSKYLARLRANKIVTYRREWRQHLYRLTDHVHLELTDTTECVEITTLTGDRISVTYARPAPTPPERHSSSASDDK